MPEKHRTRPARRVTIPTMSRKGVEETTREETGAWGGGEERRSKRRDGSGLHVRGLSDRSRNGMDGDPHE